MSTRKLKVGCAGLGRMGKRHALNFLQRTPRAELVAASSPDDIELEWARVHLAPYGVKLYKNYDDMLKHEGLEAVVVASATAVHPEQAIKAMDANKHVLCEKPLSTSVELSQAVLDAANRKPELKVMCGFSRRFDASYRDAYTKMSAGTIGAPAVIRSQTCDKLDPSGFFVAYAEFSGGIFVDCSIHDIDLALWFLGQDSKVKSVTAVGITAVEPDLRKHNDRDNAVGVVEFHNGTIVYLYASRMMAAGQEDTTEIIGPQGKLSINTQPAMNLVNVSDSSGVRREIPQTYYDRFEHAFVTEANEFTASCLDNTDVPLKLEGAVQAVQIGSALQESMITEQKIFFDAEGNRINKSKL
ncbi:putative NAD binding Rossmann fold oxidoreductase [Aspergillus clavatus NRRL 1]|uniref:NAD binding Rossmann fold oxidoreductase, putative n=1 Tax=Aspergillus clavatus (strain ATCC 1007 / CBS 513.65 / DSM 816 / NCTC 3887 / NRRL 1 / QM 1276 / 107) TaxID=344612 RepID=A1C676_ASPCL|nr:NAD binding Rossmann fold oxidoreductase, putative [Aspergillus clavatus NRRL 1]EAW13897.1 NAD binding Rossmann fold oxidoreductase, putative [Aspergillus clavatus NRRL 1]